MPPHIGQAVRAYDFEVLLYLALLLMSTIPSLGADVNKNVDIFILGGQSNMAGRGGLHYYPNGTKVFDGEGPEPGAFSSCLPTAGHCIEQTLSEFIRAGAMRV